MADGDLDLSRAAEPLPLPGVLRDRLRALVLAESAGAGWAPAAAEAVGPATDDLPLAAALAAAAAPMPVPPAARVALTGVVREHAAAGTIAAEGAAPDAGHVARPVALTPRLRHTLERALHAAAARSGRWPFLDTATARALAACLVLALLAGAAAMAALTSRPGHLAGLSASPSPGASGPVAILPGASPTPAPAPTTPQTPPRGTAAPSPDGSFLMPAELGGLGGPGTVPPFGPPPFESFCCPAPALMAGGSGPAPSPSVLPAIPARIAVVAGADPEEIAGFNAYMDMVARQGGVGDRTVHLVQVDETHPAGGDVLATVNLRHSPVATASAIPAWTAAPLLETLAVDAAPLQLKDVFDVSSTVDAQAHLVADHLLQDTDLRSGTAPRVVIYRVQDGVFAQIVPNAVASVFQGTNVNVIMVDYTPGAFTPVPADAAVLSMPTDAARRLLGEATCAVCVPRLGFTGLYSLYDGALVGALPNGSTLISPYWVFNHWEAEAIASYARSAGVPVGAGMVHGWATAKQIAIALWELDATRASGMAAVLTHLPTDPMNPGPSGFRRGHERQPQGLLLKLSKGEFTQASDFRFDHY